MEVMEEKILPRDEKEVATSLSISVPLKAKLRVETSEDGIQHVYLLDQKIGTLEPRNKSFLVFDARGQYSCFVSRQELGLEVLLERTYRAGSFPVRLGLAEISIGL